MKRTLPATLALVTLLLTGCGGSGDATSGVSSTGSEASGASSTTVENCGEEVTFEAPPERIVLLESAPVMILDGLGLMGRVVARAGAFPPDYYDDELAATIRGIDSLTEELDASGHLTLSQEEVVARDPDLVFGQPDGVTRAGLQSAGAQLLVQELYCPGSASGATFDAVYREIERYGEIFDRMDAADEMIADLRSRVRAVEQATKDEGRTAAVLYPTVGGSGTYAYGSRSMAQPQLESAGFENVFADVDDRVFEVQIEELVARDPEVLILLHQGDADGVEESVAGMPGAEAIAAVQNGEVMTQLFNFTEPATPSSVDGLERIVERFGTR